MSGNPNEPAAVQSTRRQEHPLVNILVNVVIPVFALSVMSRTDGRPWHVGPLKAMIVAVALPAIYGIWFHLKYRQWNAFSALGVVSVLLTGGLTLYLWNPDGTVKASAPTLFALKEAAIPVVFGLTVLVSWRTNNPLVRVFLFNPDVFDVPAIESRVWERGSGEAYRRLLFSGNTWMAASFFISAGMNFFLARFFLDGQTGSREAYNAAVGRLTGWGFLVIGVPITAILIVLMLRFMRRLEEITGLDRDALMRGRD